MNLADMLAHVREYIDDVSGSLVEGDNDQLWSDAAIVRHLNEAMRIIARRAWVIIDTGHPTAGRITLATGKATYAWHKSVLHIFDAIPDVQDYPIGRATDSQIKNASDIGIYDAFEVGEYASRAATADTGTTLAFAPDAGTRLLRVYPVPTATEAGTVVTLKVARMPVVELTLDDTDGEPETPREWDMSLCDYAMGKCLMRPNVDTQSKADGRELLAEFGIAVKQARQERYRAELGTGRWAFASTTALIDR